MPQVRPGLGALWCRGGGGSGTSRSHKRKQPPRNGKRLKKRRSERRHHSTFATDDSFASPRRGLVRSLYCSLYGAVLYSTVLKKNMEWLTLMARCQSAFFFLSKASVLSTSVSAGLPNADLACSTHPQTATISAIGIHETRTRAHERHHPFASARSFVFIVVLIRNLVYTHIYCTCDYNTV